MKDIVKRLLSLGLILCLLLSLAACASKTDPASPAESGKSTGENPDHDLPLATDAAAAEGPAGKPELAPGSLGEAFFYDKGSDSAALSISGGAPADGTSGGEEGEGDGDDPVLIDDPVPPGEPDANSGEALKLTAAEWNDNANWPFFMNLINAETISFPSFGLDPRNRIEVRLSDVDHNPLANETVFLMADDTLLWTARSDKNGVAYLFFRDVLPTRLVCGEFEVPIRSELIPGDEQSPAVMRRTEEITMTVPSTAPAQTDLQVMFIVDTTGSMSDELAYLQKDFSAIAERVGSDGVSWSVNFYRDKGDEYVTRTNGFRSDVAEIQKTINDEYAYGGGDTPEAVAEILTECLTDNPEWRDDAVKLAFLIFDAPPHDGKEAELEAAVKAAAEKGVRIIPVVASNAERDTELFGRALAILTNGSYVFLTDDSGVGESHLEPIVGSYEVELLQDLIVRLIEDSRP